MRFREILAGALLTGLLMLTVAVVISAVWSYEPKPPPRGTFADGVRYFENGRVHAAIDRLRPRARQDDAIAQFYLGTLYNLTGFDDRDPNTAAAWYHLAAQQGNDQARVLANRLDLENGVSPDAVVRDLAPLVDRGDAAAAYVTATAILRTTDDAWSLLMDDDGPFMKALALFDDSAEAQLLAGRFFADAAHQFHHQDAAGIYGQAARQGLYQHESEFDAVLNDAEEKALTLLGASAEQGHPSAQIALLRFINALPADRLHSKGHLIQRTPLLWEALAAAYGIRLRFQDADLRDGLRDRPLISRWLDEKRNEAGTRLALAMSFCGNAPANRERGCEVHAFFDDAVCRFPTLPGLAAHYRDTAVYRNCRLSLVEARDPDPSTRVFHLLAQRSQLNY